MADAEKYKIPLFDGSNFGNWKFRMETLLNELDLLEYVEEAYYDSVEFLEEDTPAQKTEKEKTLKQLEKNDRKCRSQIIQRVADSHLEYVKDCDSAFKIWSILKDTFERKSIASQLLLRKKLLLMKFNSSKGTLANHFLMFDKVIRELRSTGATLEETDIVCHLLLTMPAEYNNVVTAIETLSAENLTIAFVKNRLLDDEAKRIDSSKKRQEQIEPSSAFTTQQNKSTSAGNTTRGGGNKYGFRCHNCGLLGHKRADCRKKFDKNNQSKSAHLATSSQEYNKEEVSFSFSAHTDNSESPDWALDSGSTEHLASDRTPLKNIKLLQHPIKIRVAKSGVLLQAEKYGEMQVCNYVNGKKNYITIKEILLVPGLEHNLLSVRKLEKNGFRVTFEEGRGVIEKNETVAAVAEINEKQLYVLKFCEKEATALVSESIETWHKRLGHLNYESVKKLSDYVEGMTVDSKSYLPNICKICVEGKQTKLPHNQTRNRATRALQLVHSDVMGPITPTSHDNCKYIVTFIDDYTHFAAVYPIKSKGEVFHYFKIYEAMATAHFGCKLSRFRCDNGREYLSNEMKEYFEKKGIQYEFTMRYTPEQNGVAERLNRTLCEKARCLLLNSELEKRFWSDAVRTAVYLLNRSPTSALNGNVPATLWYGIKPNLNKLKVFGCVAYLHLPKQLIGGKFNSRTLQCLLIGYCTNGYKLWSPEENCIHYGRDVKFDEEKFKIASSDTEFWLPNNEEKREETVHLDDEGQVRQEEEEIEEILLNNNEEKEAQNIRRSHRTRTTPRWMDDYAVIAYNAQTYLEDVPECYDDIRSREDKNEWLEAVDEEISALSENNTWTVCELPPGKKAIESRWVFRVKSDETGDTVRRKARLVVKGCAQRFGFDYNETYAPVARLTTLRILLSVINNSNLIAYQMDVKNAFLHSNLKEEIFMKVPKGVKANSDQVCKLNKSLYGLKQAPRAWNYTFDMFMKTLGMVNSESDRCLYIGEYKDARIYLLLYVDDIIIAGNSELKIKQIKEALQNKFKMKDLGKLTMFLGIKITETENGIFLSQETYVKRLLVKFNMVDCKSVKTPMEINFVDECTENVNEKTPYRELIGCLMYLTQTTRPDLSYSVNFFSRHQSDPKEIHWKGLKRILRYLQGTQNFGLFYNKLDNKNREPLIGYADADWGNSVDRKSTSGYLFQLYGNTICWATRKQSTVAQSSTEAEFVSLATCATEYLWLKHILSDFNVTNENSVNILEDNQSCIHVLHKWEHKRLKHVDIKYNFVRDLVESKQIIVTYLRSEDQIADIFTKSLPKEKFEKMRDGLGINLVKLLK